MKKRVESMWQ